MGLMKVTVCLLAASYNELMFNGVDEGCNESRDVGFYLHGLVKVFILF